MGYRTYVLHFLAIVFLVLTFGTTVVIGGLRLKSYELCNNTQGRFPAYANITWKDGCNYLDLLLITDRPLDGNIGVHFTLETKLDNTRYLPMMHTFEKDFCKAMKGLIGPFWHEAQRQFGMVPGQCPVPPGRYHMHKYKINFQMIPLFQSLPIGNLRFTIHLIDNRYQGLNLVCAMAYLDTNA